MLRWQTAGESHGEALVAMIEGMPSGVRVTSQDIRDALARRRLGYGRGARMKFEQDQVRLLTGVRFGSTLGSPIAIEIGNTEWPKWTEVMSADPLDHELAREGRNAPLSRPRPGHAQIRFRRCSSGARTVQRPRDGIARGARRSGRAVPGAGGGHSNREPCDLDWRCRCGE